MTKLRQKLKIGQSAPEFTLLDQDNRPRRLRDYAGKKLLVYFYPTAGTPGCTIQACDVQKNLPILTKLKVAAVGISPDLPKDQKKFALDEGLMFPLLSDADHKVSQAYGVWAPKVMFGRKYMGIVRSAFLLDEQGKLVGVWYNIRAKNTAPLALAALS